MSEGEVSYEASYDIKKPREIDPGHYGMRKYSSSFSHPDYTVGSGITPDQLS